MIQKFENMGSFDVKSGRRRKVIDSTVVEEVATAVQGESNSGVKPVQCMARTLNRPVIMVFP